MAAAVRIVRVAQHGPLGLRERVEVLGLGDRGTGRAPACGMLGVGGAEHRHAGERDEARQQADQRLRAGGRHRHRRVGDAVGTCRRRFQRPDAFRLRQAGEGFVRQRRARIGVGTDAGGEVQERLRRGREAPPRRRQPPAVLRAQPAFLRNTS